MTEDQRGIVCILVGMSLFSIQDVVIRFLADNGSLTQIMFMRGLIGGLLLIGFMKLTSRPVMFRSAYPWLSLLRVCLFFAGFLAFYFALAAMPVAEATSLFFISPLLITLLSRLIFKNPIGLYRVGAIGLGFVGVLLIVKPNPADMEMVAVLPLVSALTYSISMMIGRYTREKVSVFQQMLHMYWGSVLLGVLAAVGLDSLQLDTNASASIAYLVRGWTLDEPTTMLAMALIGVVGSIGMLLLNTAYRVGAPQVIAPFEYILMPLAIINGFVFFGELPDAYSFAGIALIALSGIVIFVREGVRRKPLAVKTSLRT